MISIVMPTHQKVPLMQVTLNSVFSQSLNDFEFIVVDASKDGYFEEEFKTLVETYPILKRYESRFSNMRIIKPEKNKNFPGAMKLEGFKHCTQDNDFVIFLDHDDFLGNDLLKSIKLAHIQYPYTEMVSTKYTSMIYDSGKIILNTKTYAGGTPCESSNIIYINDIYIKFDNAKQDIYKNEHPFKATLHPKIMLKSVIRDKRFSFIEDTERLDDICWPVMSHSLIETYIPIIGYVYVGYMGNHHSNSCIPTRFISETSKKYTKYCADYEKMLSEIGYVKPKNTCIL